MDTREVFYDMAPDVYYGDPAPEASLTQSLCKTILDKSPKHAWLASPKLNPNWTRDEDAYTSAQAIGSAAHSYLLGRGRQVAVLDFDTFRTKDAQQARDAAVASGHIPILRSHNEQAVAMSRVATRECAHLLKDGGHSEVAIVTKVAGTWCRTLIDFLSEDRRKVIDYKTTSGSAAPHLLGYRMKQGGIDIQAAFHEAVLDVVDPGNAGRRDHIFIMQENYEPYGLVAVGLNEEWMTMGRKQVAAALHVWQRCLIVGHFPNYAPAIPCPEYPGFAATQWLTREQTEFVETPVDLMASG